jgi:hypothetical protein
VATGSHKNVEQSGDSESGPGRPKRQRIQRQGADALNGCLCGMVLDYEGSQDGTIRCHKAGCETQWVSILLEER